jgi:hypothetical protein
VGPKMRAKGARARSSLGGGEEMVVPVISGASGNSSTAGVDWRQEGRGGGRCCVVVDSTAWKEEKQRGA